MIYTIILSFQIWFPFLDLRSLDNSKSLFGKRFDIRVLVTSNWQKVLGTVVLAVLYRKQKRYDKNRQCYFSFLKNSLTGPGPYLLPFLPGLDLCLLLALAFLLLGLLRDLLLHGDGSQPQRLPEPPESSSWPPWLDATRSWSSTILPCDSWCTFLLPPVSWRVSGMLLGFVLQSIQRTLSHHLCRHGCSEGACRMAFLIYSSNSCC